MAVPFIDLRRFEDDFQDRWLEKVKDISQNTRFVGGPEVQKLEEKLKEDSGQPGAAGCANGTDALQLALRASGVGPDDVVLIPDSTFWATFEAVVNVGAKPVTVDIDLTDLQMDYDLFVQAVTVWKPKAAILVHLYGWGSHRLEDFRYLCRKRGIHLIEDGAQCFGVTRHGKSIYHGADLATISFYPAKVLGACGDAGAVLCADEKTADTIRKLGNHGRTSHYEHGMVGWNSRLGGFEAAYLNLSLEYFGARMESRRRSAKWYYEHLDAAGIRAVQPPEGYEENGYLNVTLQDPQMRPGIEAVLKEAGIGFGNVYPGAMSVQPGAEGWLAGNVVSSTLAEDLQPYPGGERGENFVSRADYLSRAVLNLPLFAYMKEEELQEVLDTLKRALSQAEETAAP